MTSLEAILIARKYNLEAEVRQELASGLSPEEALQEWDILQNFLLINLYLLTRVNSGLYTKII